MLIYHSVNTRWPFFTGMSCIRANVVTHERLLSILIYIYFNHLFSLKKIGVESINNSCLFTGLWMSFEQYNSYRYCMLPRFHDSMIYWSHGPGVIRAIRAFISYYTPFHKYDGRWTYHILDNIAPSSSDKSKWVRIPCYDEKSIEIQPNWCKLTLFFKRSTF